MLFAVIPTYVRGQRLSDSEIEAAKPLVGDLKIDEVLKFDQVLKFDEIMAKPDGTARRQATLSAGSELLLKPIVEPRITGMSPLRFGLRGLEKVETPAGTQYVLQEWLVEERLEPYDPGRPRASALLPNPQAGR